MRRAAEILRGRADEIAMTMTMEQGKPLAQARQETLAATDIIEWFAGEAQRTYGQVIPARSPDVVQMTLKLPVGPVAAFTPWNFPINQVVRKLSAALASRLLDHHQGAGGNPGGTGSADPGLCRCGNAGRRHRPRLRRPGGDLRVPDPASGHPQDQLHRLDARRQAARRTRRPAHEARHDGARRSCPGDRGRGCRSRSRGRHDGALQVPQCRAGLRLADPLSGAGPPRRRVHGAVHGRCQGDPRRQRDGRRDRDGPARQRPPHSRPGSPDRRRRGPWRAG